MYILMTLLLGFAAVNTGNNLLYLLVSALLGFMAVSGILGRGNLQKLKVAIEAPDEIYDGRQTLVTVRLDNDRRLLPAFLIRVTLLGRSVTFHLVERRGTAEEELAVTFSGRGRMKMPAAQICSIFPINFFLRCRTLAVEGMVTVFPAPRPCRRTGGGGGQEKVGELPTPLKGLEGEVDRIGDYRGGEPLKMIHWKLSARHNGLKVKELSDSASQPVIIDLDLLPGAGLEERLCCGAFLVDACLRQGWPVGLRLGKRLVPPAASRAHKLRLLTELALYGQG